MRSYALTITAVAALLLVGSSAQAQVYDISGCGGNTSKVKEAVDGALTRIAQISTARADVVQANYFRSFGNYSNDPNTATFLAAIAAMNITNSKAVLSGSPTVNPFGAPPVFSRLVFECANGVGAIAVRKGSKIVLDNSLFFSLPFKGVYTSIPDTRIGTILHETIHVVTNQGDILLGGMSQGASAVQLVQNKDTRAFINAENYEWYYMSFLF